MKIQFKNITENTFQFCIICKKGKKKQHNDPFDRYVYNLNQILHSTWVN